MTRGSWRRASSTAATTAFFEYTFVMPREDPARAGLTKTGKPRLVTRAKASSRRSRQSRSVITVQSPTGRPADRSAAFMKPLSIASADASTPDPTYGTPCISSRPCTVPSSPHGPCSTGNTTSTSSAAALSMRAAESSIWGSPASLTTMSSRFAEPPTHAPSRVMPTTRTSCPAMAPTIERALMQEISCSLLRPPTSTAIRVTG